MSFIPEFRYRFPQKYFNFRSTLKISFARINWNNYEKFIFDLSNVSFITTYGIVLLYGIIHYISKKPTIKYIILIISPQIDTYIHRMHVPQILSRDFGVLVLPKLREVKELDKHLTLNELEIVTILDANDVDEKTEQISDLIEYNIKLRGDQYEIVNTAITEGLANVFHHTELHQARETGGTGLTDLQQSILEYKQNGLLTIRSNLGWVWQKAEKPYFGECTQYINGTYIGIDLER